MEDGADHLFRHGQRRVSGWIEILSQEQCHRSDAPKDEAGHEDQLGVQAETGKTPVAVQVNKGGPPDGPEDDQHAHGHQQEVPGEHPPDAASRGSFGKDGETRVVERRHRQEHGLPEGLGQAHPVQSVDAEEDNHRPHAVDQEDHQDDGAGDPAESFHAVDSHGLAHHQAFGQGGAVAQQRQDEGGDGHEGEAADEHESEDDGLSEVAPVG